MLDLSGREIAALITAIVGVGSFLFALARFPTERSDKKQETSFESQERMRETYREISVEIMSAIGQAMSPRSTEEFTQAWYDIEQLYIGRARLLPSVKNYDIKEALEEFMDGLWGTWSRMTTFKDLDENEGPEHYPARWVKMEAASAKVSTALQKMISHQHNIGTVQEIKSGGAKKSKSDEAEN